MPIVELNINRDFPKECAFVDYLLNRSMRAGRCAPLLRNMMVVYAAGISQKANASMHLFEPESICQTIRVLENPEVRDLTKGPFQYKRGPLKGLYKKHFFQASFMPQNILNAMKKDGIGILYRALIGKYGKAGLEERVFSEEDAKLIAAALMNEGYDERAKARALSPHGGLTGEHLIFAKTKTGNVYLHASFHGEDEALILDSAAIALQDFPDLMGSAVVFSSAG